MRIALVDSSPHKTRYSLALLKLGAWRKSLGDECKLFSDTLPRANEYDEIWITTTFTYDIPHAVNMVRAAKKLCKRVVVGGVSATLMPEYFVNAGADVVHSGLLMDAEFVRPDYSLLDSAPSYSIIFTSRGCPRKCGFCMVRKIETEHLDNENWHKFLCNGAKDLIVYDNNWLAKDRQLLSRDIRRMSTMSISSVDFIQGIDCRLMTDDIAKEMSSIQLKEVRFAFDSMQEDVYFQDAVRRMARNGFRSFCSYMLYNFTDTPQNFYYRLRQAALLSDELDIFCDAFPMCYRPVMSIRKQYVGKRWTEKMLRAFRDIVSHVSNRGVVAFHSRKASAIEQFEYWFGANEDEFVKILNYDKIKKLCKVKMGKARWM